MSATPKRPIPLKTKQIARNAKNDPSQRPIARNLHRNAQPVNYPKSLTIARNEDRNRTCLRCGVAPFSSLREGARATGATIPTSLEVRS